MSAETKVVWGSMTVVQGLNRTADAGVECSVVLPSCQPSGGLREAVWPVAQHLFAQGISCEILALCNEPSEACAHAVADLSFVRVINAPDRATAITHALTVARGVWVTVADDVENTGIDPFEVAESLHRAREREVETALGEV
jgi:hypothetical protein